MGKDSQRMTSRSGRATRPNQRKGDLNEGDLSEASLSRTELESAIEEDPTLVPTGPSVLQVEDAVLEPAGNRSPFGGLGRTVGTSGTDGAGGARPQRNRWAGRDNWPGHQRSWL